MTRHQDKPEATQSAGTDSVRVVPPPKVTPMATSDSDGVGRGASFWLTTIAFVALGAIALGVFLLLPRWVSESSTVEPLSPSPEASATVSTEIEDDQTSEYVTAAPVVPPSAPSPPPAAAPRDTSRADFARAMATGLAQLDRKELKAARVAFETALALSPGASEAAEGLARVEAAEQLAAIASHRERAIAFERDERWTEATVEYTAALALDPALRFGQDGLRLATARSELSRDLNAHIERPDRLSEDTVLAEAGKLLARAERTKSPGPVLARQIELLAAAIAVASTPIRVEILSDEITSVLVYRVGQLGTFARKHLQLRPGTYTVVGTRKGFRDVRHQIEVKPGTTPSVTVRCEEKI
jgi:hypothetical protein